MTVRLSMTGARCPMEDKRRSSAPWNGCMLLACADDVHCDAACTAFSHGHVMKGREPQPLVDHRGKEDRCMGFVQKSVVKAFHAIPR